MTPSALARVLMNAFYGRLHDKKHPVADGWKRAARAALAALTPAVGSGECSGNTHEFAGGLVCRCGQVYVSGNEILSTTPPPTVPDYWYADGENMIPPKSPPPTECGACRDGIIRESNHTCGIEADEPTEPEGELVSELDKMIVNHDEGCGCDGNNCEWFGITSIRKIAALARARR